MEKKEKEEEKAQGQPVSNEGLADSDKQAYWKRRRRRPYWQPVQP